MTSKFKQTLVRKIKHLRSRIHKLETKMLKNRARFARVSRAGGWVKVEPLLVKDWHLGKLVQGLYLEKDFLEVVRRG